MAKKNLFEFWAVDKNGDKYHEFIETKSGRNNKVKKIISEKYNIDIDQCRDFGIRKVEEF